jgi:hypothetical protein
LQKEEISQNPKEKSLLICGKQKYPRMLEKKFWTEKKKKIGREKNNFGAKFFRIG